MASVKMKMREEEFKLTLSREEAMMLRDVLSCVAGHPDLSRRKHADAVFNVLTEVVPYPKAVCEKSEDLTGSILFSTK